MLRERHGTMLSVIGVGTTGSGRHLAGRLLGADLVKNEITAQLAGTLHFFPDVDTIFEIGGQDSKYIRVGPRPSRRVRHEQGVCGRHRVVPRGAVRACSAST